MAIFAPKPEGNFELAPAGTHRAVCYAIYDLGTRDIEDFETKRLKKVRQIRIVWELSDEMMADGRPFSVGEDFKLSLHEKSKLCKFLEAWRGRKFTEEEKPAFDLASIIGKACLVTVTHNPSKTNADRIYANISGVSALVKGMAVPNMINQPIEYSITETIPDSFPDWLKKRISESDEHKTGADYGKSQASKPAEKPAQQSPQNRQPAMANVSSPPGPELDDDEIPF
jgi:hypothetical protein